MGTRSSEVLDFPMLVYNIVDKEFIPMVATFVRWGTPEAQEVKTDLLLLFMTS